MLPESAELVFFAAFALAFAFVFAPAAARRPSLLWRGGAGIGLLPYLHPFDPDDAVTGSPIAWMAFIGPALAVVVAGTRGLVPAEAGGVFGAMLIGVGLLNVAWGGVAAWLTESTVAAWRY